MNVPLGSIRPHSTVHGKGLLSYQPYGMTRHLVQDVLDVFKRMEAADALPIGPRGVGYRLKELHVGRYTKDDFRKIEKIVRRLQQAGQLPWAWVADGSALTYEVGGWANPDDFLREAHTLYERERREGQPVVVEVSAEARETTALIRRLGAERGVTVYSGGGSSGPNHARKVALRALHRAVEYGQSTLILGICDFDQSGIRNVLRPHIEHVSAFLYGTAGNEKVLAVQDDAGRPIGIRATDASVSFRHLALTPEMAAGLVETEDDQEAIAEYIDSGTDIWGRDLDLLDGVQKIETEALDPAILRNLVVNALDEVLDTELLDRIGEEEDDEREDLEERLCGLTPGGAS